MKLITSRLLPLFLTLSAISATAAPVTFAQFNDDASNSFIFSNGSPSTFTATTDGVFRFTNAAPVDAFLKSFRDVTITLNAQTSAAATTNGVNLTQGGLQGYIAFNLNSAYMGQTLLLRADFDHARLKGTANAESGAMVVSLDGGDILNFTSSFLDVSKVAANSSGSLSLTSLIPGLSIGGNGQLASFVASGNGSFSGSPVPEPMTFALSGAALLGLGLLRRRS